MVRMPHGQHGSRKAIEHWRGFRALPQTRIREKPPWAVVLERSNMKKLEGQKDVSKSFGNEDETAGLPAVRTRAAGIDLGSELHWVCAPRADGKGREVATFGATTPELEKMAAWLKERKVETTALESTGVYWIAPHGERGAGSAEAEQRKKRAAASNREGKNPCARLCIGSAEWT